jgi:hypothetical protein
MVSSQNSICSSAAHPPSVVLAARFHTAPPRGDRSLWSPLGAVHYYTTIVLIGCLCFSSVIKQHMDIFVFPSLSDRIYDLDGCVTRLSLSRHAATSFREGSHVSQFQVAVLTCTPHHPQLEVVLCPARLIYVCEGVITRCAIGVLFL